MTDVKDVNELPDALNNWMALSKFFPESGRLKPTWGEIREVLAYIATLTRERDELRTLAKDAINYMVFEVVACHGLKCRERNCESCCDEDDAKAFVLKSREVIAALTAAIAKGNA